MGFLDAITDFCRCLKEGDDEQPPYTPSEGLESRVYDVISNYGHRRVGEILPTDDIIDDLHYDTELLDHVALRNDIDREFGVRLPLEVRKAGEIFEFVKGELERRGQGVQNIG